MWLTSAPHRAREELAALGLRIVLCDPARLHEVFALRARVWLAEGAAPHAFPDGRWSDPRDAHRMHWVALDDDRIVAAASLDLHESLADIEEPEAYASITAPPEGIVAAPTRVVVDPAYRGRGIANALLDRQDEAAREAGAVLAVRQASPAMQRILERRGWHDHGPAPADPRFPNVAFRVMSLELGDRR